MSSSAIICENIGKRYRLGERAPYHRFTDLLTGLARLPWQAAQAVAGGRKKAGPEGPGLTAGDGDGGRDGSAADPWFWALKDVNFQVQRGEVIGIIGRNGAGKSTLLKLLSRITEPTEGQIRLRGRVGSLLEVGTGFHPELTGRENIFLNGAILGMPQSRIRSKFDEIVAFAETEKFLDTPVKHYSSGMYMRLAFAVAAHLEPDTLIVDEVLAVGDAAFQKKCLGKMGDVASRGRTVLFVSHNMLAVRELCTRCVLLDKGQVVADGLTAGVLDQYMFGGKGGGKLLQEIETETWPRPFAHYGTDFRVIRVGLDGEAGEARVAAGAPLRLYIDVRVTREIERLSYGFGVFGSESQPLVIMHNTDAAPPLARLSPGEYRLRAEVPVHPLTPGNYRLDIGVGCESKGLDWLRDLLPFEVYDASPAKEAWLHRHDGLFRQEARWYPPESLALPAPDRVPEST